MFLDGLNGFFLRSGKTRNDGCLINVALRLRQSVRPVQKFKKIVVVGLFQYGLTYLECLFSIKKYIVFGVEGVISAIEHFIFLGRTTPHQNKHGDYC